MKRQKGMTLEDEPLRLPGVQYATGEEQRHSSRKNEEAGLKQKQHSCECVFWWKESSNAEKNKTA